ncbi:helix-turn-helix transcriptional regulator [Myxococcus sp. MISCRS1]|uniref:PadR family transcriptional regulator n=1 Tax=Myxococcus sp. MISCRS1 TaxID=2996786 RepID=UPI00227047CB|nr:helix-turn-helix transcriptional regulator [Myxococcus sp. MISCRS1]MCY1003933.1 helix-turn-helix transcriptional regulator [Myxococcus sp. MISCRS1]
MNFVTAGRQVTQLWCGILGVIAHDGDGYGLSIHEGLVKRELVSASTDPMAYLYDVLRDMEARGWLVSREVSSPEIAALRGGRPRICYALTDAGSVARQVLAT